MSIKGSFDPICRVEAIDRSYEESEQQRKQKRRVQYMGHQWEESEENEIEGRQYLPKFREGDQEKLFKPLLIERMLLDRAKSLLAQLITLEDKVAHLFFYETEAVYDSKQLKEVTELLQRYCLGGIIFVKGSYKREAELVEYYQTLAKIPLLIGNDFIHNLSLYFQKEIPEVVLTTQRCRDLGKAIMGQNRSMGAHFIFDRECFTQSLFKESEEKKSFRKGVRQAQGVVARDLLPEKALHRIYAENFSLFWSCKSKGEYSSEISQHFIGMRTLFLQECGVDKEQLVTLFTQGYDGFVVREKVSDAIDIMISAVREGVIREEEIEQRLIKLLIIKAFFGG